MSKQSKQPSPGTMTRRQMLKSTAAAALAFSAAPAFLVKNAWAEKAIGNFPVQGNSVVFGFNVPQTGAYADEELMNFAPTSWL